MTWSAIGPGPPNRARSRAPPATMALRATPSRSAVSPRGRSASRSINSCVTKGRLYPCVQPLDFYREPRHRVSGSCRAFSIRFALIWSLCDKRNLRNSLLAARGNLGGTQSRHPSSLRSEPCRVWLQIRSEARSCSACDVLGLRPRIVWLPPVENTDFLTGETFATSPAPPIWQTNRKAGPYSSMAASGTDTRGAKGQRFLSVITISGRTSSSKTDAVTPERFDSSDPKVSVSFSSGNAKSTMSSD